MPSGARWLPSPRGLRGSRVLSPASPMVSDEVGSHFSGALVVSTHGLPVQAELAARVMAPFTNTFVSQCCAWFY